MKKWQKFLIALFAAVSLGSVIGAIRFETADAGLLSSSHGVEPRPNQILESRAWATMAGNSGVHFRVRHYRRHAGGSTRHLNSSNWSHSNGGFVRTPWVREVDVVTFAILEGSAW